MKGFIAFAFAFVFVAATLGAAPSVQEVKQAIDKAATYYRDKAAVNGGYVYYYSPDFSRRLGEGVAEPSEIWVQPPGTPTVGEAFLDAHEATGSRAHLDTAIAAGKALVHGQLESGAWQNSIDFNPAGPRTKLYRNGKEYSLTNDDSNLPSHYGWKNPSRLDLIKQAQVIDRQLSDFSSLRGL